MSDFRFELLIFGRSLILCKNLTRQPRDLDWGGKFDRDSATGKFLSRQQKRSKKATRNSRCYKAVTDLARIT